MRKIAQGVAGAPSIFQNAMMDIFSDLYFVLAYIDDILVYSKSCKEHLELIQTVLERIRDNGLSINKRKSKFATEKIEDLGYEVERTGIKPLNKNLEGIKAHSAPKTKKQLMFLLGALNFFRILIPNYSALTSEMTKMTFKNVPLTWTKQSEAQLNKIKFYLIKKSELKNMNFSMTFYIYTDGSDFSINSVVFQDDKHIWSISKKLNKVQKKYSIIEKETYAIVYTLMELRHILLGQKVVIFIDHSNLVYLKDLNNSRSQRWLVAMQEFNPDIKYVPGRNNRFADYLSRADIEVNSTFINEDRFPLCYKYIETIQKDKDRGLELDRKIVENSNIAYYQTKFTY